MTMVVVALGATLAAGCCGGAPSHQCNFVAPPAPPRDAAAETALLCGMEACSNGTVCCLQKVPPFATCVDPAQYTALGCEQTEVSCFSPHDCPFGLVCCNDSATKVSCKPDQLCPGDGQPTYRICDTNTDCPRAVPNCTQATPGDPDAGIASLSICL